MGATLTGKVAPRWRMTGDGTDWARVWDAGYVFCFRGGSGPSSSGSLGLGPRGVAGRGGTEVSGAKRRKDNDKAVGSNDPVAVRTVASQTAWQEYSIKIVCWN